MFLKRRLIVVAVIAVAVLLPTGLVFGMAMSGSDSGSEKTKVEKPTAEPPASKPEPTATAPKPTEAPPPADTTPPALAITRPKDGEHVTEKQYVFKGTTEPGAKVFAGDFQANVDSKGNWSIMLILSPGANGAHFRAVDAAGNVAEASVTVHLDVAKPKPPADEKPADKPAEEEPKKHDDGHEDEHTFKAAQEFGSCSENPPYDVFYGKGAPGATVTISSPYGHESTTIDPDGKWKVKVFFPTAPMGVKFAVTVTASTGEVQVLHFKRTAG
jgi:hypothetical protein